jgi:hypothetical protein
MGSLLDVIRVVAKITKAFDNFRHAHPKIPVSARVISWRINTRCTRFLSNENKNVQELARHERKFSGLDAQSYRFIGFPELAQIGVSMTWP